MSHGAARRGLVIEAVARVGCETDLGPVVAAREAWDGCDADVADRAVQLVALDLRAEWTDAPDRIARTDRLARLAVLAARRLQQAMGGAPLEHAREAPTGLVFSSALATLGTNESFHRRYRARELRTGRVLGDAHLFPYTAPNAAAGEVAIAFGLHGPPIVRIAGGRADLEALRLPPPEPGVSRFVAVAADVLSPAALRWLLAAGLLRDGEVASEGAIALLLREDDEGESESGGTGDGGVTRPGLARVVEAKTGLADPSVARATRLDTEGRVRFGLAQGLALVTALAEGRTEGSWRSICPTGAWTQVRTALL